MAPPPQFVSVTVSGLPGAPVDGVALSAGPTTVSVWLPDVPPPGAGVNTVMLSVPLCARSLASTVAVSDVALPYVVARAVPLTRTTEVVEKLCPLAVSTTLPLPAATVAGLIPVSTGAGPFTVSVWLPDVPPPGAGVNTVMLSVPACARSLASTVAVSDVLLPYVVARAVPFTCTTELAAKPLPVAVSTTLPLPAATVAGVMDVSTGADAVTVSVWGPDVPPPGAGVNTVIVSVPLWAKSLASTVAVSDVALPYVVARAVPFTCTTEVVEKLCPVAVSTTLPLPAATVPA